MARLNYVSSQERFSLLFCNPRPKRAVNPNEIGRTGKIGSEASAYSRQRSVQPLPRATKSPSLSVLILESYSLSGQESSKSKLQSRLSRAQRPITLINRPPRILGSVRAVLHSTWDCKADGLHALG